MQQRQVDAARFFKYFFTYKHTGTVLYIISEALQKEFLLFHTAKNVRKNNDRVYSVTCDVQTPPPVSP
jgi:hypothetical protein